MSQNIRLAVRTSTDHYGSVDPTTFDVEANFGTKQTFYEPGKGQPFVYLNWGMDIKQMTSTLVFPENLTFGPSLVAFSQQTDNPYYSIDTSVFTVDSYYRFETWLQNYNEPTKPYTAVVGEVSIEMLLFKYTGIYDTGKGKYLQFQGYKWDSTQWYSPTSMLNLSTEKASEFTTFR